MPFACTRITAYQVKEYANKWFLCFPDLSGEEQTTHADTFLRESAIVPDLRSNPLMLALMCNIYKGETYIPKNRPDVYAKCALMLFERWDKSRGINVSLPFEEHIKPAMMYLAFWIYENDGLQGGVTERLLNARAAQYLHEKRFETIEEAESAANQFIDFCRGRAWVFTDTGSTSEGEALYQFTHRTFLEYFAASHLVRVCPTADMLYERLRERIANREWDVLAQLAFQLQYRSIEDAGERLLERLHAEALVSKEPKTWNLLSFGIRCLEFLVVSPRVIRAITETAIQRSIDLAHQLVDLNGVDTLDNRASIRLLIGDLLNSAQENRSTVFETMQSQLYAFIEKGDEINSWIALEIALNLELAFQLQHSTSRKSEALAFCDQVAKDIHSQFDSVIRRFAAEHFTLCITLFHNGKLNLTEIVNWHGFSSLFRAQPYSVFLDFYSSALFEVLLSGLLGEGPEDTRHIVEFGSLVLHRNPWTPVEFLEKPQMHTWLRYINRNAKYPKQLSLRESAHAFGAIVILAFLFESIVKDTLEGKMPRLHSEAEATRIFQLPLFERISLCRLKRLRLSDVDSREMSTIGMSPQQVSFLESWTMGKIDLFYEKKDNNSADEK